MLALSLFLSLLVVANAADLALYWGQASAGSQKSLAEYCSSTPGTIYVVSFLSAFSGSGTPTLNLAGACTSTFSGSSLLHCPQVAQDIKTCQSQGKKILLSLGGAAGSYGFTSDSDGEAFAQTLWDMFGGGTTAQRPFDDAVVDGFDFDIENNNQGGYVALANKLRQLYSTGSKQYYISAAPQCPYPDASVGDLLSKAQVDFAFIQFYNNYCSTTGSQFNWDTWQNYATNTSPNKNIKLFLGLPGSTSAAGSGYATPDQIKQTLSQIKSSANFGGVSVWDASQADLNVVGGQSFAAQVGAMLGGSSPAPASPAPPAASSAAVTLAVAAQNNAVANAGAAVSSVAAGVTPVTAASAEPTTTVKYTVTVTATSSKVATHTFASSLAAAPAASSSAGNYLYTPGQLKNIWSNSSAANAANAAKWSNDTGYTTVVRSHTVTVTVTVSPEASGTDAAGKLKAAANLDVLNKAAAGSAATVTTVPAPVATLTTSDEPTTYYTTTIQETITVQLKAVSSQVVKAVVYTVSPSEAAATPSVFTSYRVWVSTIVPTPAGAPATLETSTPTPSPTVDAVAFNSNSTNPYKRQFAANREHYQHRHNARNLLGIVV